MDATLAQILNRLYAVEAQLQNLAQVEQNLRKQCQDLLTENQRLEDILAK